MSPHYSDPISQRSQISIEYRVALWICSLNVFVFVIFFVFVFIFVIAFLLVRSYPLITLIKCLKGHKSLGSLCSVLKSKGWLTDSVSEWQGHLFSCCGQLKMLLRSLNFAYRNALRFVSFVEKCLHGSLFHPWNGIHQKRENISVKLSLLFPNWQCILVLSVREKLNSNKCMWL